MNRKEQRILQEQKKAVVEQEYGVDTFYRCFDRVLLEVCKQSASLSHPTTHTLHTMLTEHASIDNLRLLFNEMED